MADKTDMDLTPEEQAMLDDDRDTPVVLDETDEEAEVNAKAEEAAKGDKKKADGPARGDDGKFKKAEAAEADAAKVEEAPAEAEPKADGEKDGMVPIQALDRARQKENAAQAELAELRAEIAALKTAQQAAAQAPQQPAQQQPVPEERPDPVMDPDGFFRYMEAQRAKDRQPYEQLVAQAQQQQAANQQMMDLKNYAAADEAAFSQQYPDKDYNGALKFARDVKQREMRLMGYPEEHINQLMTQVEIGVAQTARHLGVSPAAYIWNYAMMHGYQPGGAQAAPQPDAGADITRLADVQRQTQSGAGRAGAPREDEMSVESLLRLSDDEFAKLSDDDFRRAVGG